MSFITRLVKGAALTWAELDANFTQLTSELGASLVGFIQAGIGAVARTVQSKERDVISLKDFGAVGDGTTDDTAAINAAIAAVAVNANLGKIFVPAGIYKITSTIIIDFAGPLVFEGAAGGVATISTDPDTAGASRFLNATAGGTMFKLQNTVVIHKNVTADVTFIDCGFQNDLNAGNIAVEDAKGYDKTAFIRCSFIGGSIAYKNTGAFNTKFENCEFHSCTYGYYGLAGVDALNMTWWDCIFRYCGNAIYTLGGNSFYFYNCLFEACTGTAVYLDGVYYIHFIGSHWEQNGGAAGTNFDVYVLGSVEAPKQVTMHGCTLMRDNVTAPGTPQLVQVRIDSAARGTFTGNLFGNPGGTAGLYWNTSGGPRFNHFGNNFDNPLVDANNQGFGYLEGTWTPAFIGLTVVNGTGGAIYSGTWIKVGNRVDWTATIAVTGTATTASTLGTTYINNMPFTPLQNAWQSCTAIDQSGSGSVLGQGVIRGSGSNVIQTPTWGALNHNITISGSYIASMAA